MSFRLPKFPMLTLFHNPASDASNQALKLLHKAAFSNNFEIDVVDSKTTPPTHQQVSSIVGYLGKGSIEKGCRDILAPDAPKASTVAEVQKILDSNPGYMMKPLVVDWNKGKAIVAVPPTKVSEMVKDVGESE
ncbi:hypothetical protein BC939DRAFT_502293 [Gamsiella multidivaricata]|uniref:uncharacterized protein n=1 Tax=Gamsiella multidivaricata TaxID=101098 RepID=UPI00221EBF33|nr:uncharacterized protein BC939DRAFT_502293 [Gamsiella multidivaricata]KAG0370271.1 hypothetical protein BGZ54_007061 [Gamsiella multidivaricata]KAI7825352.1 hypothetical protein BC939DRAFT_502293 [Gamsiella multidivaricata]